MCVIIAVYTIVWVCFTWYLLSTNICNSGRCKYIRYGDIDTCMNFVLHV